MCVCYFIIEANMINEKIINKAFELIVKWFGVDLNITFL